MIKNYDFNNKALDTTRRHQNNVSNIQLKIFYNKLRNKIFKNYF